MATPLNVDAQKITKGIYIVPNGVDLDVLCNWCGYSAAHVTDTDLPDTQWLVKMITHFNTEHPTFI